MKKIVPKAASRPSIEEVVAGALADDAPAPRAEHRAYWRPAYSAVRPLLLKGWSARRVAEHLAAKHVIEPKEAKRAQWAFERFQAKEKRRSREG